MWDYWTKGEARRPGAATQTILQLLATHREIRKLMQELKREGNPAIRRTLHAQLEQSCRLAKLAAAEKLKLPTTMEFRRVLMRSETPRYVEGNKTVNSRLYGRAVKCWMFSAV
ncbi:hypothetical protein [Laribacter hongkongensis]|uniref:Uncharacterized protein n=1 Tax=Laribacter hongkongensis TaxID=168471 RepID=A0A248LHS4_9NEIS|nr:hypothetical protein [Laribacter hongkongensis]ASJ24297.1 hypothetical protein LHGZ1_1466 [Laribacter hongkongensis]MCG9041979.1 hypothetical protein [Laribacter hongkongensis]MCG9069017.1 hypothetical protein [Laribacter hongkongensis]MCG9087701.1 hypothetical protein [Laribacter hongkongensis]MCG9110816.1 hypothetical protein [Laribacter hongkongensis]